MMWRVEILRDSIQELENRCLQKSENMMRNGPPSIKVVVMDNSLRVTSGMFEVTIARVTGTVWPRSTLETYLDAVFA
jgi:hypothetical protein